MNGLGYALRETGHNRVPEPPERMTGINTRIPPCLAASIPPFRELADYRIQALLPWRQV
jgi:hypothetical protein